MTIGLTKYCAFWKSKLVSVAYSMKWRKCQPTEFNRWNVWFASEQLNPILKGIDVRKSPSSLHTRTFHNTDSFLMNWTKHETKWKLKIKNHIQCSRIRASNLLQCSLIWFWRNSRDQNKYYSTQKITIKLL